MSDRSRSYRRTPLTDAQRRLIAAGYRDGVKLEDIADGVSRKIGTIKTAVRMLRADGMVGRRYLGTSNV